MQIMLGVALLVLFAIAVALIMRGQSPIICLLVLAIAWPAISGVSLNDITSGVIQKGADTYAATVVVMLFGAWFGQVVVQTGIAESLVRAVVELAGDRPVVVLLAMDLVVFVLFTSLYGVGAAIAVGVIVLPILMTMGIPVWLAAASFTMSLTAPYVINILFFNVLAPLFMKTPQFGNYLPWLASVAVTALLCTMAMGVVGMARFSGARQSSVTVTPAAAKFSVPWYAYITPLVPVIVMVVFKWPVVPTFLVSIVFALAVTWRARTFQGAIDLFHKTFYDAFPDIATIAALFVVCGMLIVAGGTPQVQAALTPIFGPILPTDRLSLVLFFALLAPCALYRGPFIPIGTGAALIAVFLSVGRFPGEVLFPFWMVLAPMFNGNDPTSSQNIWAMGYTKITHRQFLTTSLPFAWLAVIITMARAYFVLPIS